MKAVLVSECTQASPFIRGLWMRTTPQSAAGGAASGFSAARPAVASAVTKTISRRPELTRHLVSNSDENIRDTGVNQPGGMPVKTGTWQRMVRVFGEDVFGFAIWFSSQGVDRGCRASCAGPM